MFDTIINKFTHSLLSFSLIMISMYSLKAQENEEFRWLKFSIGGGYGHYFNTFTNVLDNDIKNNRPAFNGKLLWQPEHRLRIGLESGYYLIYSTTRIETAIGSEKLTTHLNVVPIFLSFSMKLWRHWDINFATGWASLIYTVNINNSKKNKVIGHTYSMSNYAAGLTYHLPLGKRFEIGTEFKYLYIGKTDDYHISAFLNLSYKFKKWKVKQS